MCRGGYICVVEVTCVSWKSHMCPGGHICVLEVTYAWRSHMCRGGHICVVEATYVPWKTHVCRGGHVCVVEVTYMSWSHIYVVVWTSDDNMSAYLYDVVYKLKIKEKKYLVL